ncbi:MAG: DUF3179 domain-containing protein [bacterium]|nr:DUF3179 domain-containing protein [bacterium]
MAGRSLWFRLAGLNNQNFIMEDEETGTWWQQVSGEALRGPFEGERLELVHSDEISLGLWKREHPDSTVLLPDDGFKLSRCINSSLALYRKNCSPAQSSSPTNLIMPSMG